MRALWSGKKWARFLSLWMQGWSGTATLMYIMSVAAIRHYEYGFFDNPYRNDLFISSIMGMIKSLILVVAVILFQKLRWRLLAPIMIYGIDLPLYYLGILVVEIPFWIYTIIYIVLATLLLWWSLYAYSYIRKIAR